jgi:TolB-like protein/DNA-binding winged helix-turn-helix (wHTH) protein/Tfp pilus assembly protein PilF
MPQKTACFYDFGGFRLNPSEHALLSAGTRVPLTPKAFEILLVLVENAGHTLEKDDLLKRIWPTTFVEEGTLARNISTLRKALGEGPEGQTYIETVPRHGYCFIAPVQQAPSLEPAPFQAPPAGPSSLRSSRMAFGLLALFIISTFFLWLRWLHVPEISAHRTTLAVLPFENLSGEPAQQFFADGFSEEMSTQLGSLEPNHFAVIALTSGVRYQGSAKDAREVGRELGAEYLLTGSVRREADRVRITARLIRGKDGTILWAEDYDRNVRDILALQSEVANAIAREISLKLPPEKNASLSAARRVDPDAYENYLRGRYFWNKRTPASYLKAIEYFNDAIARDPKYAEAYSGLADAYALLGSSANAEMPRNVAMPKAKAAALAALQLDDSLAEAHTSLAFEEMHYEWDWRDSERQFLRALELNPNYATAHQWYALWLMAQATPNQALAQLSLAEKADPLSIIVKSDTSQLLTCAGLYEQAVHAADRALELDANFPLAHLAMADAYLGKQMDSQAILEYQKVLATDGGNTWARTGIALSYAHMGQPAEAQRLLNEILQGCRNRSDCAFEIAAIYSNLGEKDRAFAWIEKAYQDRDGSLILLNQLSALAPLRSDPRYSDLARRVGLSGKGSQVAEQIPSYARVQE